jgi:hypothetical protein
VLDPGGSRYRESPIAMSFATTGVVIVVGEDRTPEDRAMELILDALRRRHGITEGDVGLASVGRTKLRLASTCNFLASSCSCSSTGDAARLRRSSTRPSAPTRCVENCGVYAQSPPRPTHSIVATEGRLGKSALRGTCLVDTTPGSLRLSQALIDDLGPIVTLAIELADGEVPGDLLTLDRAVPSLRAATPASTRAPVETTQIAW